MHTTLSPTVRGFAFPDLVATLGGIALLALIGTPMAGRGRLQQEQSVCSSNLRVVGQSSALYAQSSQGLFPSLLGGAWPWDLPAAAANRLIEHGARRRDLYCPSVPRSDRDLLWRFTTGSTNDIATPETGFRVVGYQFAFTGAGRVLATNLTESLTPKAWLINGTPVNPPMSERVIAADAILSLAANEADRSGNVYTGIDGGVPKHDSAHLAGSLPAGGNLLMADGHIDWRRFSKMRVRTASSPSFWW